VTFLHNSFRKLRFLLALYAAATAAHAVAPDEEVDLKAAIVLNVLRYSTWPDHSAANAPVTVGILGKTSFAKALRPTLEGKAVDSHPIRLIEIGTPFDPRCCQAIIVALENPADLKQALSAVRGAPILTIGEADRFLDSGGTVNLLEVDGHMSFEVSIEALERSGVAISSKLLRFGQVKGRRTK
jgi:hypothetical protein